MGSSVLPIWFLCKLADDTCYLACCRVDKKKVAARKAAIRAAASGVLAKPGVDDARGDLGGLVGEQSGRATFPQLQGQPVETQWGGLAGGASAEGVEYGKGRPALRANFSGRPSMIFCPEMN